MSDLTLKTTRGILWSLAETLGLQAIQLLISIILARLLLPEQFGLIGMLMLFMALAQSLLDSGFGSALIQKKDAGHLGACSVFYFNLLLGVVLTLLLDGAALWNPRRLKAYSGLVVNTAFFQRLAQKIEFLSIPTPIMVNERAV